VAEGIRARWERLLLSFFGVGNKLVWPSGDPVVTDFVAANEKNLAREPPGPFVLPRVGEDNLTTYVAIATDDDQAQHLRRILGGVVGNTYTTYTGRPVESDLIDQFQQAAIVFAGAPERVLSLRVVGSEGSVKREVRAQVLLLLELIAQQPERSVTPVRPIGRLLRDFERALTSRLANCSTDRSRPWRGSPG
jgi:hypothetical protein